MKATFENSVDVLVKAYLNDTLIHGNCIGCAVGNLVCAAGGSDSGRWYYSLKLGSKNEGGKEDLIKTGYSHRELIKIEAAFEMEDNIFHRDEAMFNGLLAVVDVLAEIHGVSLETKQSAVGQFEEIHATK